MGFACLYTLAVYIYEMYLIWSKEYFIERTYLDVTETVDFEQITSTEIMYFLYRNETDDARDVDASKGLTTIVDHVAQTCGGDDKFYAQ